MSAFRDLVSSDVSGVFLDAEYFAEPHAIAGRDVLCVVEADADDRSRPALGIAEARMTVHAAEGDLAGMDFPSGGTVNIDGELWLIDDCERAGGMLALSLLRNG